MRLTLALSVALTACTSETIDPAPSMSQAPRAQASDGGGGSGPSCPPDSICNVTGPHIDVGTELGAWRFEEVSLEAGLTAVHDWDPTGLTSHELQILAVSGGVATTDFDNDGLFDVYVVGCTLGQSALYRNLGDGTFDDVTVASEIEPPTVGCDAGPIFADVDGDGLDDLFIGGVAGARSRLDPQTNDHRFVETTSASGLDAIHGLVYGGAFADVDQDGDLDLAIARWSTVDTDAELLFENAAGVFTPRTAAWGLSSLTSFTFTPNFVDMNEDGLLDLLVASDFHTSRIYVGAPGGQFVDVTSGVIDDDNGMGSAIGDYDGDGHFDWFLSSVWDPDGVPEKGWGISGNRMYRNAGDGTLVDATDETGLREGYWGWGSCFADFDNDGDLDLFHVNGFNIALASEFFDDPSRLFLSNGDGTFTERSAELGIIDTGQGRGVVCFDYDRDGDIDILVQQNRGPMRLYRNNGAHAGHFLDVALHAPGMNTHAIGARVEVTAAGVTRIGVVRAGSNYASQDPMELHFGLASTRVIDSVVVKLPGAPPSTFGPFDADQRVRLELP